MTRKLGLAAVVGFLLVAVGFTAVRWGTLVSFHTRMEDAYGGRTGSERLFAECFAAADPTKTPTPGSGERSSWWICVEEYARARLPAR